MEILQMFTDLFNALIAAANAVLNFLEWLLSPVTNLIERWNNLFPGE
ncbi:MAG TPA: hypothetical protein VK978_03130 [Candidatus Saccharimonadales bacterium]|nr:hypothetical protein [Candidatus Saccharimonadales bacterium]